MMQGYCAMGRDDIYYLQEGKMVYVTWALQIILPCVFAVILFKTRRPHGSK
jgi:hypothetical protein